MARDVLSSLISKYSEAFQGYVMPGRVYIVPNISGETTTPGGIVLPGAQKDGKFRNADRLFWGFVIAAGEYRDRHNNLNEAEAQKAGWPLKLGRIVQYHHPVPFESMEDGLAIIHTHDIYRVLPEGDRHIPNGPMVDGADGKWVEIVEACGFLRKLEPVGAK